MKVCNTMYYFLLSLTSWAFFFVDFDVVFKHSGDSLSFSANLTSEETQLTISMWIKIPTALNNIALYKAGTASCDIEILYRNILYFIINGYICFAFISIFLSLLKDKK